MCVCVGGGYIVLDILGVPNVRLGESVYGKGDLAAYPGQHILWWLCSKMGKTFSPPPTPTPPQEVFIRFLQFY